MTPSWSLPGYDVEVPLGSGAGAGVWRATQQGTGRPVALRRLPADADPEALRRQASVLRALDTPYVVRVLDVVVDDDATVLVLDLAAGGSLAALQQRRGALEPGEVVTVAAPIAQALAAAHAVGLVHGAVSPSAVLLTGTGMPLLSGLGPARTADAGSGSVPPAGPYLDPAVPAGGAPTDASDVWALAALCHHLLAGRPPTAGETGPGRLGALAPATPRALVDTVEAALVRDPALRPDAAGFAAALRRAHAASPVRFPAPPPTGPAPIGRRPSGPRHAVPGARRPRVGRRRRPGLRRLGLTALGALLLVIAASLGPGWDRGPEPLASAIAPTPSGRGPTAAAGEPDWPALLDGLDAVRARAFATADASLLGEVYAPGAPGLRADRALVEQLASAGRSADGVRHVVRAVDVRDAGPRRARLEVVDVLDSYAVRDASGAVLSRAAKRGERAHLVELARTTDGWRLVEVTPV